MAAVETHRLIDELASVRWGVAAQTYGSDHATPVGLLVDWWVSSRPNGRWALEAGPSYGYVKGGKGRGQCDALLCEAAGAVGLVEVEGYRRVYTVRKIDKFFASRDPHFQTLAFAILVLYAYSPVGRGPARAFAPAADAATLDAVSQVSDANAAKTIAVITVDKIFERTVDGIRARNDYYRGTPSLIKGALYLDGECVGERTYFQLVG